MKWWIMMYHDVPYECLTHGGEDKMATILQMTFQWHFIGR